MERRAVFLFTMTRNCEKTYTISHLICTKNQNEMVGKCVTQSRTNDLTSLILCPTQRWLDVPLAID